MRLKAFLISSCLVLGSTCFALFLGEIGYRLYKGTLTDRENLLFKPWNRVNQHADKYPIEMYDPKLGWVTKPNAEAKDGYTDLRIKTMDFGLRADSRASIHNVNILAVGDSFTFGDEVGEEDTWPAQLSSILDVPVLNGGVSGYGLDQTFLRLEQLLTHVKPKRVIFSFIGDDIKRCRNSVLWGMHKPFFTLENSELKLHNVPVPTEKPPPPELTFTKRFLGQSYLVNAFAIRFFPNWWLEGLGYASKLETEQHSEISCAIMKRFAQLAHEKKFEPYVLAQYEVELLSEASKPVIECARQAGIDVIDLYEEMAKVKSEDPMRYADFFFIHMTPRGNRFVAEAVAKKIRGLIANLIR